MTLGAPVVRASGHNAAPATSHATASFTATAGEPVCIIAHIAHVAYTAVPTLSGLSVTGTDAPIINSGKNGNANYRTVIWNRVGTGVAGALTIALASGNYTALQWLVIENPGGDAATFVVGANTVVSTPNGSKTSWTVARTQALTAGNRFYCVFCGSSDNGGTVTERSGWTELYEDVSYAGDLNFEVQYRDSSDTLGGASWITAVDIIMAIFEVAAVGGGGGTPDHVTITTEPDGAVDGVAFTQQPVVEVRDSGDALLTGETGTMSAEITTGSGTLGGTTSVSCVGGVATFTDLFIDGPDDYVLTFTYAALEVDSASFTVDPEVITSAEVQSKRSDASVTVTWDSDLTPGSTCVLTIKDGAATVVSVVSSLGNTYAKPTGASGTISGGNVTNVYVAENVVGGTEVITITMSDAGAPAFHAAEYHIDGKTLLVDTAHVVSASGGSTGPSTGASGTLAQADNVIVGCFAWNASGNPVTDGAGYTGYANPALDSNSRTYMEDQVVAAATSISAGITLGTSRNWTAILIALKITDATPVALSTQPVVQILDGAGLPIGAGTQNVNVSLASGSGTLSGTTPVACVDGVATFTDLAIAGTGDFTLQFTSPGLTPVTSDTFTM